MKKKYISPNVITVFLKNETLLQSHSVENLRDGGTTYYGDVEE
jgi:hypothetical protein